MGAPESSARGARLTAPGFSSRLPDNHDAGNEDDNDGDSDDSDDLSDDQDEQRVLQHTTWNVLLPVHKKIL